MVGGQAPKAIRSVECYDFEEGRWDQIAELPSRRCRAGKRPQSPTPGLQAAFPQLLSALCGSFGRLPAPPTRRRTQHIVTVYSEVSSYMLVGLSQFMSLLKPGKVRETNRRRNQSPIVPRRYLEPEVAFHRESVVSPAASLTSDISLGRRPPS